MAEEVEEEQKKGGLVKIIIFVVAGIMLIVVGLGIGYLYLVVNQSLILLPRLIK